MNKHIAGSLIYLEWTNKVRKTLDLGMKIEPETEFEIDFVSADTGEEVLEAIDVIDDVVARLVKMQCTLIKPIYDAREVSRTLEERLNLTDHLTAEYLNSTPFTPSTASPLNHASLNSTRVSIELLAIEYVFPRARTLPVLFMRMVVRTT